MRQTDDCAACGKVVSSQQQGIVSDGFGFWQQSVCEKLSDEVQASMKSMMMKSQTNGSVKSVPLPARRRWLR